MEAVFINHSSERMPKEMMTQSLKSIFKILKRRNIKSKQILKNKKIVIAFVEIQEMIKLNKKFRNKKGCTDILSFESVEDNFLGELVICPKVIARQAFENNWTQKKEFSYMILHGILHLLGYDHKNQPQSQKMFTLQDSIFEELNI